MPNLSTADASPFALARTDTAPRRLKTRRPGRGFGLSALSWLIPVVLVVLWEAAARWGGLSPQVLPAPSKVVRTAAHLIANGQLLADMGISLLRAGAGFVIGGSAGFLLGIAVGFSPIEEALLDRSVQMLRAVPFLAVLPLVMDHGDDPSLCRARHKHESSPWSD